MEHDSYKLWEALGTWAAAVATFAAVIVSLWLARKAERPRLIVSCDQRVFIDPAMVRDPGHVKPEEMPDIISLDVTNVGMTRVRIIAIGWQWILIREQLASQNPPEHKMRSHGLPAVLEHGDQLQWALPFKELVNKIATHTLANSWWWQVKLQLLCIVVHTSTRQRFRCRLGPTLRKSFAEETSRIRAVRVTSRERA